MRLNPPKSTGIVILAAMLAAACTLCVGLRAAYADKMVTATLKPNLGVGVGFDKLAETEQSLTIVLYAPYPLLIDWSKPRDNDGRRLWKPEWPEKWTEANPIMRIDMDSIVHTYKVTGLLPNHGHAVGFEGELIVGGGEEEGTPPDFDAAVADVDIDVDSLGRCQGDHWPPYADDSSDGDNEDASEATDSGGLYLPPALHDNQPEDEEPFPEDTDGTKYKILNVEVRPMWKGPPDVQYVGTLTFEIAEAGVALYGEDLGGYITKDSSEEDRTIDIKPDGLSEEYHILTNNDFTETGGITATFKWYHGQGDKHDLRGNLIHYTAVDDVRLAPVIVTFSPDPVRTGFTIPVIDSTIKKSVTATVVPKQMTNDIEISLDGPPTGSEVRIMDVHKDADAGTITFDVKGLKETHVNYQNGRTTIEAKYGGDVAGKVKAIVYVPKDINTPHPTADGDVTPVNLCADNGTSPRYRPTLFPTQCVLATHWSQWMTIRVDDQWGNALNDIYEDVDVEELYDGSWWDINQDITAGGTYQDPVSFVRWSAVVLKTSQAALDWPTDPTLPMGEGGEREQRVDIRVGGHQVGQVKRDVTWTPPNNVKVEDAN